MDKHNANDIMERVLKAQEELQKCSMELQEVGARVNGYTLTICDEGIENALTVLKMYAETIIDMIRIKKQFRIETVYNPEDGRLKSNFYEIQS